MSLWSIDGSVHTPRQIILISRRGFLHLPPNLFQTPHEATHHPVVIVFSVQLRAQEGVKKAPW